MNMASDKKTLYLANPYGFSSQQREGPAGGARGGPGGDGRGGMGAVRTQQLT